MNVEETERWNERGDRIAELEREVRQLTEARADAAMHEQVRRNVETVLDKALGPNEEDGTGQGLAADVALLAAQRDQARRWAVEMEQQLAEIKRLAYVGGQDDSIIRRCIIGVFEDERRAVEGGEGR